MFGIQGSRIRRGFEGALLTLLVRIVAEEARDLLQRRDFDISSVAERVGYASSSTFSTAFSRHVGTAPGRYARARAG